MPTIRLEINATVNDDITLSAGTHANEMKFKGVLVNLDTPSTKPPNGSQGKKIMIPMSTAKAALHTLINMGLNYTDKLDGHNPRRKVGVIKKAWIEGSSIHVSGIIWKKDFPEAETDLKKKNLGMSFEATDIGVEDEHAPIWKITNMCFTGASILYKKDAAYHATEALAAAKFKKAISQITKNRGGIDMGEKKHKSPDTKPSKKVVVAAKDDNQLVVILGGLTEAFKEQGKQFALMAQSNNALKSELHAMASGRVDAGGDEESESLEAAGDEESESLEAAFPKKKGKKDSASESESMESGSESMSADADDAGDLEDMESDEPEEEDKPGHLNKDSVQKGNKTKVEDKVGKEVNEPILGAKELRRFVRSEVAAARAVDAKKIEHLEKELRKNKKQLKAAGERTERRTISAAGRNLLAKNQVDPDALMASNRKLTVEEVDGMLSAAAGGPGMDPAMRMALKTEFAKVGIMDEGIISRTQVN